MNRRARRIAWAVATWFGCGRAPVGPGTVGSLGALPVYFAVRGGGAPALLVAAFAIAAVGVWASTIVARELRVKDPSIVVVDEVVGTLVALAAAPRGAVGVVAAVALFRVLDITKPFPVSAAERLPRGWGIVADDVVAGALAAAVVLGLRAAGVLG